MTLHSAPLTAMSSEANILSAIEALPPQLLSPATFRTLPLGRVSALVASLNHAFAEQAHAIIHVISAYQGEGVDAVAFEAALTAAKSGKRVLFLDATAGHSSGVLKEVAHPLSLDAALGAKTLSYSPFCLVEGTSLYCASLSERGCAGVNPQVLSALLARLRDLYDFVFIRSEAALGNGSAATFAALTDGTLIVVEAERTRTPVLKELIGAVENNGGRVLGAVLNKRRYYIPRFIYSLLFGR